MASIQTLKGGSIRVSVCKLGVRATKTFPPGERVEARQWGTKKEAEIILGAKAAKVRTGQTLQMALERFREDVAGERRARSQSWENTRINFLILSLGFAGRLIRKTSADDLDEWILERSNVVMSSTINRDLNLLSAVYTAAKKWGWVDHNPVGDVVRPANPEPRNRRIGESETCALLGALGYQVGSSAASKSDRVALAFLVALETGMRKGELLKSTWAHAHADHIHLPASITKNGYKRDVPLTPAAKQLLGLLPRHDDRLFAGMRSAEFDEVWRKARDRSGVADLHFHDTRHEAVTRLSKLLPLLALAKMIGHRDLKSLMIYYNPTPSEIAALLAAPLQTQTGPLSHEGMQ